MIQDAFESGFVCAPIPLFSLQLYFSLPAAAIFMYCVAGNVGQVNVAA